ncbi:MAG TPA: sulfur carrier protein ThiS [Nocardioidaceae bacterium]|nr:sulfur carrier protein ThiS [Nocardioidaceae bacterium]
MKILVNGDPREVPTPCSLGELVPHRSGVAAALNGNVIRGMDWDHTALSDGDAVEVLTAFQGG